MSHISLVQTPVKAAGKKRSTVFFLPKLSLNFTSTSPVAVFDLSVKSGAFDPTLMAIDFYLSRCGAEYTLQTRGGIRLNAPSVKRRFYDGGVPAQPAQC